VSGVASTLAGRGRPVGAPRRRRWVDEVRLE
jgi:hypothetical protein